MSTSFWMILGGILLLCAFVFTKTVSNDARNDYMLRDILSNTPDNTDYQEEKKREKVGSSAISEYEEHQNKVYASIQNSQGSQYSTTMHTDSSNSNYHTNCGNSTSVKEPDHVQEESYYQKDRCMETDKVGVNTEPTMKEQKKTEPEPVKTLPKRASKFLPSADDTEEEVYSPVKEVRVTAEKPHTKGVMSYIKTFWRGITFTLGGLACLYGLYMFMASASMGADTLVATLWVLIGVILVK